MATPGANSRHEIPPPKGHLQAPHLWVFTTYFAEGFPYTLVRTVSSVFFRDMKVSLESVGLTSLFGLPWVLKFLWGPQVDQFGTKRAWMLYMQSTIVAVLSAVGLLAGFPGTLRCISALFFFCSFVAATHDISIDGYYMEALDPHGQAKFVGYRVMAYRIAMMAGTGIIVTMGTVVSWHMGFLSAAALLGILFSYHMIFLPKTETYRQPFRDLLARLLRPRLFQAMAILLLAYLAFRWAFSLGWYESARARISLLHEIHFAGWVGIGLLTALIFLGTFKNRVKSLLFKDKDAFYTRAFVTYMDRDKMGIALAFIILMRTGESLLGAMVSPFIVDLGIKVHYGWISGGVGLPFSILGAMLGGWLISRFSLRKMIWPFLLAQNLTNLVYMGLALLLNSYVESNTGSVSPVPMGQWNLMLVASVHAFDQFAGGLGTSVLVTFLMRTCLTEFKAAHFAIGSGLMNVGGVLSGVTSGFLANWLGYGVFFGISFLASIPGMALIPLIPFVEENPASP